MHALVFDPGGDLHTGHGAHRSVAFRFTETVGFYLLTAGSYHKAATIDLSGLNTEPASLIHLVLNSLNWAYPQVSLQTCLLSFGQVGLASTAATHPLAGNKQFLSSRELPRLRIYLGMTRNT